MLNSLTALVRSDTGVAFKDGVALVQASVIGSGMGQADATEVLEVKLAK